MARPNPNDFRVLPPNDEDLIPLYIGSDVSKPFWIKWKVLREILTPIIPSGTAAWGSIATGGGVASQTDLIAYLVANYYPLLSNPAGYVTATQLSTTLLGYVTTAALTAALANYVPTSRTLTINGVTFDLSADRTWTISGTGLTSVGLALNPAPSTPAFQINNSPLTSNGNLEIEFLGTTSEYVRGDGSRATLPSSSGIPKGTAAGTDIFTTTIAGVTSYVDGDAFLIRFTNGNTTQCTLNINSLGAKDLYRNNDGVLIGGDIIAGAEMLCVYNSTLNGFQVIGTAPNTLLAYVTNDDSVTITKGQPVYAFGGTGDRMTVKLAQNTSDATSAQTVGLVLSSSIAANQKGLIMMQGLLDGLSILPTATWSDGDPVYLGATAGSITNVKPQAPNHLVYLGVVTTASNGSAGRLYVRVQNGYELGELHDVQITSPANDQVLAYESGLWKNKPVSAIIPAPVIYVKKVYSLIGTYLTSTAYYNNLLYFASFFIGGGTGGTQIFNATTAAFNSTSTFTQALYNRIVNNGGTDEVYVISQAQTTIQRLTASTGAFIANTALTGVITTGVSTRFCQFNSTKVFFGNSANFFVLNPATFVTTNLTAHGLGNIPYVAVNNNPSSPQNGTIMMGGPNGIILINGTTNAISVAATTVSGAISAVYDVQYDSTNDVWIVLTVISSSLRIVYLKPSTATTFTVPTTIFGVSAMGNPFAAGAAIYGRLMLDEANSYLFLYSNHRLTQIRLTTGDVIQSIPIQSASPAVTTAAFSSADIDLTNKRIFAASGLNNVGGQWVVNEIMYT
jgi:hypothetical protein